MTATGPRRTSRRAEHLPFSLRPRVRIAWWAAVLATAAAYVFRALVSLGGDMRPQLPADAIIGGVLAALLIARMLVARWAVRADGNEEDRDSRTRTGTGDGDRPGAGGPDSSGLGSGP